MNGTITQCTLLPYTLIPVIPGKPAYSETREEQVVRHYDELIHTIMKTMEILYITYCIDEGYQLIMSRRHIDIHSTKQNP